MVTCIIISVIRGTRDGRAHRSPTTIIIIIVRVYWISLHDRTVVLRSEDLPHAIQHNVLLFSLKKVNTISRDRRIKNPITVIAIPIYILTHFRYLIVPGNVRPAQREMVRARD